MVVHVLTQKGRGYAPASQHPDRFHGTGPFDIRTGRSLEKKTSPTYTDVFAETMCRLGAEEPRLVGITAAMPEGTGLKKIRAGLSGEIFLM